MLELVVGGTGRIWWGQGMASRSGCWLAMILVLEGLVVDGIGRVGWWQG